MPVWSVVGGNLREIYARLPGTKQRAGELEVLKKAGAIAGVWALMWPSLYIIFVRTDAFFCAVFSREVPLKSSMYAYCTSRNYLCT